MNKKIAFVFPGQGSQTVGMLDSFENHPVVLDTLRDASAAIGFDLVQMIHDGPATTLALTENTQPVMLAAAIAIYRVWLDSGGHKPALLAGHSLGEYTALVAAEVLTFEEAIPLVRFRAQAMQTVVPIGAGGMAAVMGASDEVVSQLCAASQARTGKVVEAVNFNAPNQVVIAGYKEAVDDACAHAKEVGARMAIPLDVSAPFHSSLLRPAADQLQDYLSAVTLHEPKIAFINNVDVQIMHDPIKIKDALIRQSYSPVRWVQTIQLMVAQGITHIVECGPGKVLSGMIKRIDGNLKILSISDQASIQHALEELNI